MDKKLICHDIALLTAKAFVDSNMPEYINNSGAKGYASDMIKKYLEVYPLIKEEYENQHPPGNGITFLK
ncbi:hypothetical protein [Stenotrophomonas maltophilia group sp. RNC7]|uniref:hypothetical protein n=1 Tax=Stenotrophomonas maltophilia group sp. RNC7 TaxID=3071467 RepID=UPI0027DEE4C4|nr:hypothetical protein [Stenotrophomonas maltophilia group sp. RNC7]MDQ4680862.1 hypothetical protein [Stenotrophomonas maltophilia group sp. RNC7]